MIEPDEITTTPCPGPPVASTNASNSEISLIVEGIGTPPQPEWFSEYEAPMPMAPWSIASATCRFISAISAAVGALRTDASIAHHGGAHGRMPDQHAEVHVGAAPAQHRHVFGKGLEPPVDAGAQRIEIHSLPTARLRMIRSRRCEGDGTLPEAAIPHHRRSHAERRQRRQRWIPGDLRVVMRVQVDARHQREPGGVDDPGRVLADRDDAAILDRAVGAHRVVPEPVDYCCSADHEVMHHDSL